MLPTGDKGWVGLDVEVSNWKPLLSGVPRRAYMDLH